MNKTLLPIRIVFGRAVRRGGVADVRDRAGGDHNHAFPILVGLGIGVLVVLVDVMLKGFSLRGLSAITFGIGIGLLIAHMVASSPLLEQGTVDSPSTIYLIRLGLFLVCPYLAAVIALRARTSFTS